MRLSPNQLFAAIALILLAVAAWTLWPDSVPLESAAAPRPEDDRGRADNSRALAQSAEEAQRQALDSLRSDSEDLDERAAETQADLPSVRIAGRVLDIDGLPLAGREVVLWGAPDTWAAVSDLRGAFEMQADESLPRDEHELAVLGKGWVTIASSLVQDRNVGREHLVVAAQTLRLAGTVRAASGEPIAWARLTVATRGELQKRFPYPLDMMRTRGFGNVSDRDGAFDLGNVPGFEGATVSVSAEGFEPASLPMPSASRSDWRIVLDARSADPEPQAFVEGRVLLPDLSPAEGASLQSGSQTAESDAAGRFRLPYPNPVDADAVLAAAKQGYGTAVMADFGRMAQAVAPHPPGPLTLVLGERHVIAGVVLASDGTPKKGWEVGLWKGTELSANVAPPPLAEALAGNAKTRTDSDGNFRLTGLGDRNYVLRVYDPATLLAVLSDPIPAGTEDVVVRVPANAVHERIAGRVVARDGRPVPNVAVRAKLFTYRTESASSWVSGRDSSLTDESGAFELEGFPRSLVSLELEGESIMPEDFELQEGAAVEDLRLEVARRCHFRILLTADPEASAVASIEDEAGGSLVMYRFQGKGWSGGSRMRINADEANVFSASEHARVLVLERGDSEQRLPLLLDPTQVSEIRVE